MRDCVNNIPHGGGAMLKNLHGEKRVAKTQAELNVVLAQHELFAASRGGRRAQLGMADLSGLNLANRTLNEADFAGASLEGASLFGATLVRTSFYCSDLRKSDLRYANLLYADMRGATFRGANLSFARMDHADLRVAMMMFVSPIGISMVDRNEPAGSPMHGVDFTNCSLKNVSFGNAKLDGANFSGALLQGANFRGAKLDNVTFEGAVMTGVNLAGTVLPPEALKGCVTDVTPQARAKFDELRAKLEAHQQWIVSAGKQGSQGVLDGEDIRPLQKLVVSRPLSAISARDVIAVGLNFSGCQLQAARFDGADLRDADFTGADLRGASFKNAKIAHARFANADLRNLQLENGKIRRVDFAGALGSQEQFEQARLQSRVSDLGLTGSLAA
jgi:uncharacterized protein YjbI with pentapeptide repeats